MRTWKPALAKSDWPKKKKKHTKQKTNKKKYQRKEKRNKERLKNH